MEGRLREVLEGLLERGVRGAALLRPDGLLLEAVGEASGAAERAAARVRRSSDLLLVWYISASPALVRTLSRTARPLCSRAFTIGHP